jgi:hypothetical protein
LHFFFLSVTICLMNPNQAPVGPQREFTEKALAAKFSFSFTRGECIMLVNLLRTAQLPMGDARCKILIGILDTIENAAIHSISNNDYKQPAAGNAQAPLPPASPVQTN